MTELEAQAWLDSHGWWDGAAGDRLRAFVSALTFENERQNLVARSTLGSIWARHIVDSAQLLPLVHRHTCSGTTWIDVATGAGFPGLVIACLVNWPMRLIEPRPLRTAFLSDMVERLGLTHVEVTTAKVERIHERPAAIISARAFATLERILQATHHLSDADTLWLLPKGKNAQMELATAQQQWQGVFHVEQSCTDKASQIIVARKVAPRNAATRVRNIGARGTTRGSG